MLRSLASNMLTVLIFGFFLIGAMGIWGKSQYVAEGPLKNAICFKVKSGTSMRTVVQDLVNDKAISSEFVFRVGMESSGLSRKIKAGSFLVPENASMAEISKRLTESGISNCGNQIIYRVGVTSLKIEIRDTDPNTGKMVKVGDFIFDEFVDEKINELLDKGDKNLKHKYIALIEDAHKEFESDENKIEEYMELQQKLYQDVDKKKTITNLMKDINIPKI